MLSEVDRGVPAGPWGASAAQLPEERSEVSSVRCHLTRSAAFVPGFWLPLCRPFASLAEGNLLSGLQ